MPLPDPIPPHMLDFLTYENSSDPSAFPLPDNNDIEPVIPFPHPAVPNSTLHPVNLLPRGSPIPAAPPYLETYWPIAFIGEHQVLENFLRTTYSRVANHWILDKSHRLLSQEPYTPYRQLGPDNSNYLRTVYLHLHNGLVLLRRSQSMQAPHLYHWTRRALTYLQDKFPQEGLGQVQFGRWFITPDCYNLVVKNHDSPNSEQVRVLQPPYTLSHPFICDRFNPNITKIHGPYRMHDYKEFLDARFTVHFVDLTGQNTWGFILRHAATQKAWLFAPLKGYMDKTFAVASEKIRKAFNTWLRASDLKEHVIRPENWKVVKTAKAPSLAKGREWTSGLHVIAHLMVFVRFGLRGWGIIKGFRAPDGEYVNLEDGEEEEAGIGLEGRYWARHSRKMCKLMMECLHRLLGLTLETKPPGEGPIMPPVAPRERGMVEEVESELQEREDRERFSLGRREYEFMRRYRSWEARRRALMKEKKEEKEFVEEYTRYFDQMNYVNGWLQDREWVILQAERREFKAARRNRRERIKLEKQIGIRAENGGWLGNAGKEALKARLKRTAQEAGLESAQDQEAKKQKVEGEKEGELEPMDYHWEEKDPGEFWYFNDDYLDSTDDEDPDKVPYGWGMPLTQYEKWKRHQACTSKYGGDIQKTLRFMELIMNKKSDVIKYIGDKGDSGNGEEDESEEEHQGEGKKEDATAKPKPQFVWTPWAETNDPNPKWRQKKKVPNQVMQDSPTTSIGGSTLVGSSPPPEDVTTIHNKGKGKKIATTNPDLGPETKIHAIDWSKPKYQKQMDFGKLTKLGSGSGSGSVKAGDEAQQEEVSVKKQDAHAEEEQKPEDEQQEEEQEDQANYQVAQDAGHETDDDDNDNENHYQSDDDAKDGDYVPGLTPTMASNTSEFGSPGLGEEDDDGDIIMGEQTGGDAKQENEAEDTGTTYESEDNDDDTPPTSSNDSGLGSPILVEDPPEQGGNGGSPIVGEGPPDDVPNTSTNVSGLGSPILGEDPPEHGGNEGADPNDQEKEKDQQQVPTKKDGSEGNGDVKKEEEEESDPFADASSPSQPASPVKDKYAYISQINLDDEDWGFD